MNLLINPPFSFASSKLVVPIRVGYLSFAFCACRARRAMSSALSPFAARRKSAISRGRWRMMSVKSDATRPAKAPAS